MNVEDLRNPFIVASYQGPDTTIDHNGYVKDGFLYVSHYRRGLVVFDASDPEQLHEVASFDTFLAPAGKQSGFRRRLGRLSVLPVRNGRDQRHQQWALRAARPRGDIGAAGGARLAFATLCGERRGG